MHLDVNAVGRAANAWPQKANIWARLLSLRLSWAVALGLIVMAIYLLLLPFVARTWRTTGDEPHYLLAAHSLVNDFDFDLANNYANFDYLNFYYSRDIVSQVRLAPDGQQILNHHLGLPILIAPAYAAGGRFGVLLFQAMLGGLLALFTFKLALFISQDTVGSVLAAALVALSPPLLIYNYLVYPELAAALLTTLVLYFALTRNRVTPAIGAIVWLSLAMLPWLNRRFVPMAIVLALVVIWSWRHRKKSWPGLITKSGLTGLLLMMLSLGGLLWLNSQLSSPLRVDITAPPTPAEFWLRLARGTGWLLDQQRGLFIFAPIYILALWGVPILLSRSWRQRNRHWLILLPILASLAVVILAGGYWISWEAGPRFLVAGLPPLAVLLALAWVRYRHSKKWLSLAAVLVGLTLLNSWVIITNPELPYKSSLPFYYGDKLSLPLTDYLPDLAGYMRVTPITAKAGESSREIWSVPVGDRHRIVEAAQLDDLPFGHYTLTLPLRTDPNLPPDTPLLRLSINHLGGGPVLNRTITAADLPPDGNGVVEARFINTNIDRWRTPMLLHGVTSGKASLLGGDVLFTPQPFYALFLPWFYLAIIIGGVALSGYALGNTAVHRQTNPYLSGKAGWALLALLLVAAGYFVVAQSRTGHTYDSTDLAHLTGQPITDPQAADGHAWLVDPAIDPPQKAVYGPFDFYDAGQYQVTFRLKLPHPVDPGPELARLNVAATANFEEIATQPLFAADFPHTGEYRNFQLTITNPRRQALSFEVDYPGIALLVIDGVTVEKVMSGE